MKSNEQLAREWWENYIKRCGPNGSPGNLPPLEALVAFAKHLDSLQEKVEHGCCSKCFSAGVAECDGTCQCHTPKKKEWCMPSTNTCFGGKHRCGRENYPSDYPPHGSHWVTTNLCKCVDGNDIMCPIHCNATDTPTPPTPKDQKISIVKTEDYFKDFELDKGEDTDTCPYYESAICKICEEKITGLSPLGALSYMTGSPPVLFGDNLEHHLELHITEQRYIKHLGKPSTK